MHNLAGTIGETIGFVLYSIVLVEYYYLLPKRVALWEKSEDPEDKKKLGSYKKAIEVYKMHWGMRVIALMFAIWFVDRLSNLI